LDGLVALLVEPFDARAEFGDRRAQLSHFA
jgi:hypothetical protein